MKPNKESSRIIKEYQFVFSFLCLFCLAQVVVDFKLRSLLHNNLPGASCKCSTNRSESGFGGKNFLNASLRLLSEERQALKAASRFTLRQLQE